MLIVFGRNIPFSHREIMLVLFNSRIIATSFCLSPLAFLYRLRLFGMFWDLVFTIFSPKDYSLYQAYNFRAKHNKKGKIATNGNFIAKRIPVTIHDNEFGMRGSIGEKNNDP
jgi:hypothetical protein